MPLSLRTVPDHVSSFVQTISAEIVVVSILCLVTLGTGIATLYQVLVPAIAGYTEYKALILAALLFLVPTQGLASPFFLARDRPTIRLLCLAAMLLAAVGAYLAFLYAWNQSLHQYLELLGLLQAEMDAPPGIAPALREKFLPHVFIALLKDLFATAYLECVLWYLLRSRRIATLSALSGRNR